jgi:hypothetical protein
MNTLFANDLGLMHLFHCVDTLRFFESDTPNLTEAALAYDKLTIKVITIYLFVINHHSVLCLLLCLQFRQVNLETIFYVFC